MVQGLHCKENWILVTLCDQNIEVPLNRTHYMEFSLTLKLITPGKLPFYGTTQGWKFDFQ